MARATSTSRSWITSFILTRARRIKINNLCPMCQRLIKRNAYDRHVDECYKFACSGTLKALPGELSGGIKPTMSFTRHAQKLERPWSVLADFESTICQPCDPENELGSGAASSHEPMPETRRNALRKANSACAYLVCNYDSSKNQLWSAIGDDCVLQLLGVPGETQRGPDSSRQFSW